MKPLHIAVNTRLLLPGKLDGIGWFTFHTLKKITKDHPEAKFTFLFDRPWSEEFIFGNNVHPVSLFPQARHPFLYYWWFQFSVPSALRKCEADVFLSPDGYLSLRTDVPQLAVIHDLNFEHYPEDLPALTSRYYRHYFPKFARKATRIATVSEYSKKDIVERYSVEASSIDVVYNGVNPIYRPADAETIQHIRNRYTKGDPYFLFVGMLHPRKNITNLLRAFEAFRSSQDSPVKLLIVGHRKWWTAEMEMVYSSMRFRDEIVFTGRLSIEELAAVTASALACTYVSYFEGFGVPIIESMRSGVPVITSNVTSMPEVAGGTALLIDPFEHHSIAEAMTLIYRDELVRNQLIEKGLTRSNEFSWDKTANLLWKSIEYALSAR